MPDETPQLNKVQYFKAVRPTGRDHYSGTIDYSVPGSVVTHPNSTRMLHNIPSSYLSVSTSPEEALLGGSWPCRLFEVEPIGDVMGDLFASPHKRACLAVKVIQELPAYLVFGPQREHVVALLRRAQYLNSDQVRAGNITWGNSGAVARQAVWDAAWAAASRSNRGSACHAAWAYVWGEYGYAPGIAAVALIVRDQLDPSDYRFLTAPWRSVAGNAHPDDEDGA